MGIIKRKICLLGDFAVGKTSLVERFVNARFDEKYLTTVGIGMSQKLMPPVRHPTSGKTVQHMFLIWDIAGLEKFDDMVMNYFRGASGALAVGDLTRPDTIDHLGPICDRFIKINPRAAILPVGSKLDLVGKKTAAGSALEPLAAELGSGVMLTSAKTGQGVEDAFAHLSLKIESANG